jgi:uncharacterized membrane protein
MPEFSRYWEIDLARGIAILMMLIFHTLFDLYYFGVYQVEVYSGFWRYFAFTTATLFLLIVGISLTISHARVVSTKSGSQLALKFVYRGAGIFLLGLVVTFFTWLFLPENFIVFGILHLIGISVMLSPLFFRFKKWNIVPGFLFLAIGFLFATYSGSIWLLPLGIHPAAFSSVDYEPIFPWFGVVLIGMGLGELLYPGGVRRYALPQIPACIVRPLTFMGRHSLIIYLVHQPIILSLIALVTGIKIL